MPVAARTLRIWLCRGLLTLAALLALFELNELIRSGKTPTVPEASREQTTPESTVAAPDGACLALRLSHLTTLGVSRWHEAGYRGQGVKVAMLDSGFRGYRGLLGAGLPR